MMAVDPSALSAVLFDEPAKGRIELALAEADASCLCAPSMLEAHVVARRRGGDTIVRRLDDLIEASEIRIVERTDLMFRWAIHGYDRFGIGRGLQPSALNFGDCFSYGLAKALDAPLLFAGDDFAQTDVRSALN